LGLGDGVKIRTASSALLLRVELPAGMWQVESLDDRGKVGEIEDATGCKMVAPKPGHGPTFEGTAEQLRHLAKLFDFYTDLTGMDVPAWYARSAKAAVKRILAVAGARP
jgi:hypothetical protein